MNIQRDETFDLQGQQLNLPELVESLPSTDETWITCSHFDYREFIVAFAGYFTEEFGAAAPALIKIEKARCEFFVPPDKTIILVFEGTQKGEIKFGHGNKAYNFNGVSHRKWTLYG